MSWLQIVLLVLQLLKQFKGSGSAEQFAADVQASGQLPSASGDFLKWLWENKEQIIEFVKVIIGMFPTNPPATTMSDQAVVAELQAVIADLQG